MVSDCIFCAIAAGNAPCHQIWEDEKHLAFLSIFPNTEGFSVVITKRHYPSYAFDLPNEVLGGLVSGSKAGRPPAGSQARGHRPDQHDSGGLRGGPGARHAGPNARHQDSTVAAAQPEEAVSSATTATSRP
jgi:hypothetical protein